MNSVASVNIRERSWQLKLTSNNFQTEREKVYQLVIVIHLNLLFEKPLTPRHSAIIGWFIDKDGEAVQRPPCLSERLFAILDSSRLQPSRTEF